MLQARYTHGPGIDEPIAVTKGSATFFYHQDGLGTVTDLTNSSGATAKSYAYDAYGTIVDQPYTYTGREFDSESRLYNYRARTYDPPVERFIQKDPILLPFFPTILPSYPLLSASHNQRVWLTPTLLASPERLHAYTYVANSPMFYSDAFGLLFGIPAGESFGEESALYWADLYDQTGNPFYWIPGSLASLWTPCTSNETFLTLAGGYTARVFGPFSTKGIPRPLAKLRRYARFDPPHHGKGWHFDGTLFK